MILVSENGLIYLTNFIIYIFYYITLFTSSYQWFRKWRWS